MRYYEICPETAFLHGIWTEHEAPSVLPHNYEAHLLDPIDRWAKLVATYRELAPEEEVFLQRFSPVVLKSLSEREETDMFRVPILGSPSREPDLHLYSPSLREAVERQGLASNMDFYFVSVLEGETLKPYWAVRYERSLWRPCLRPLTYYRLVGKIDYDEHELLGLQYREVSDTTRDGFNVYRRRGALLVLDKQKIGECTFFRVLDEEDAPLVVREDVVEQWWEWGIEGFGLEEVVVE